jgi:hypothetical protein
MADNAPVKTSFEQISAYSLLLSEALFEALAKKGLLTHSEMVEQISKLQLELQLRRLSFEGSGEDRAR